MIALALFAAAAASPVPAPAPVASPIEAAAPRIALPRHRSMAKRHGARRPAASSGASRVAAANRSATVEPRADGWRNAIQVYAWSEGALYRLLAAPERITDIALEPGESLVSVAAGDTVRWIVGDTTSGAGPERRTHVLVKPSAPGLATNLLIATDRRAYHLQLESASGPAMAGLSWTYPAGALLALSRPQSSLSREATDAAAAGSAAPYARLRFGYRISGDKPVWRPLYAFDDGRQTFVAFPQALATAEAPPLFVRGADGKPELVNYRIAGDHYVVDRLFDAAELRIGGKHQTVVRITRPATDRVRRAPGDGR